MGGGGVIACGGGAGAATGAPDGTGVPHCVQKVPATFAPQFVQKAMLFHPSQFTASAAPLPPREVRRGQNYSGDRRDENPVMKIPLDCLPPLTQKIPQPDKCGDPEHRATVRKQRELGRTELADSGRISSNMANSRDEIAKRETPMTNALEPGMRLVDVIFANAHVLSVAVDQLEAEDPAERIAQRDA